MTDIGSGFPKDINNIEEQKKTSGGLDSGETSHGIHVSCGPPISNEITTHVRCDPGSAEQINCSMNVSLTQKIDDIMGTSDVLEEDEDLILTDQMNNKRVKKTEQSGVIMVEAGSSSDSLPHRINIHLDQRIDFESVKPCCSKRMSETNILAEEGISMEAVENSSLDKAADCCLNFETNSSNNSGNVLIDNSNGIRTENHEVDMLLPDEDPHNTENDVKLNVDPHTGETLRLASDNECNIHKDVSVVNESAYGANKGSEYESEAAAEESDDKFPGEFSGDVLRKDINPHPEGQSVASNVDPSSSQLDSLKGVSSQVVDDDINKFPGEFSSGFRCKDINPKLEEQSVASEADASSSQLDDLEGFASQIVTETVDVALQRAFPGYTGKKLLVLDLNGLLLDISSYVPYDYDPDEIILRKAVFKRPYCDDFLKFCFERFNVGVWTSKTKRNMEPILDFLLGNDKRKLLFCWDQSHCTFTGFSTVGKKRKPLLLKKLKKLWCKFEPDLPWEKGVYNESNTLLIDDSPHKALCNPRYTAIFPYTYHFRHVRDNSLGPRGDLRLYLEGLAGVENVQEYVKQNPFGQRAITEKNLSWGYYLKVIEASSSPPQPVDEEP